MISTDIYGKTDETINFDQTGVTFDQTDGILTNVDDKTDDAQDTNDKLMDDHGLEKMVLANNADISLPECDWIPVNCYYANIMMKVIWLWYGAYLIFFIGAMKGEIIPTIRPILMLTKFFCSMETSFLRKLV